MASTTLLLLLLLASGSSQDPSEPMEVEVVTTGGEASLGTVHCAPFYPGEICVAPIPPNAKAIDHDLPDGPMRREAQYQFSVQIDDREPASIPSEGEPLHILSLDLDTPHLVILRDAGVQIESFYFRFRSDEAELLCLKYTPWYQTWQLEPPLPGDNACACHP